VKLYRIQEPFILSIFGASGDLAKEKIFPALYSLMEQKRFPTDFWIIGYARTKKDIQTFRQEFEQSVIQKNKHDIDKNILNKLLDHVFYFTGQYDQKESFIEFQKYHRKLTKDKKIMHMAYFSVPPQAFKPIIQNLGETKKSGDDVRLIIEKPFGEDTASATDLFHFIAGYFQEEKVYLLDHYLGKSVVQSILHLRESNRILNTLLVGDDIANIQITAFESAGVNSRIGYFDQVGLTKDMIQSHLLQVLALITMAIPVTDTAESLHREKYNILSSLSFTPNPKNIVIGQYQSYCQKRDVDSCSPTETFSAVRLFIDRQNWYNVPIYIRTGKMLKKKKTSIVIEFKKFAFQPKEDPANLLVIELHPIEKMSLKLITKNGIGETENKAITTSDSLACSGDDCLPEHGLLLLDIVRGRKTHFLNFPQIIAAWQVTEKMIKTMKKMKPEIYKDGSTGPDSQNNLTAMDKFTWHEL
jgi:glucose-6-phosphate 1-dehydrogenase